MKVKKVCLRNFRRLENVEIGFEENETIFVGPNNSGKTSATTAFYLFLKRRNFRIYDFSVSKIAEIDKFGKVESVIDEILPSIEMDIWFSLDGSIEFGRVFDILPANLTSDLKEVGIRLKYCVNDAGKLKVEHSSAYKNRDKKNSLSHYLSLGDNFKNHFTIQYFALDGDGKEYLRKPDEGKRVLNSLIRVDFVDAQRNLDDYETGRSNRLSAAFATFYKNNLRQADASKEANEVIDENNQRLNDHYGKHFKELMGVIQNLGVPSVNDRYLKIVSTLRSEDALQGNTDLLYIDEEHKHELPESYNGLGFKNLVYIAIQIRHFYLQWINTEVSRPLCQMIFIEEPEVHLHAQVQQTFITNIWEVIKNGDGSHDLDDTLAENKLMPQIGITTHSSHILDAVEFEKVRYFQRCTLDDEDPTLVTILNASKVLNLRDFKPEKASLTGKLENEEETLKFLTRYLKLTHCDLFFADAVILIEGTVEKLLLPTMIEKSSPNLKNIYLTILEVGGAYAHRFASLLEFIRIPYLVITDLDSVDPSIVKGETSCRADTLNAVTSNETLKFFLGKTKISDLVAMNREEQILANGDCFVAFQKPTDVDSEKLHGRTLEETFVYQNIKFFRNQEIKFGNAFKGGKTIDDEYDAVYKRVKSGSFKKVDFALDVALSESKWTTPEYIAEGLSWLEEKFSVESKDTSDAS